MSSRRAIGRCLAVPMVCWGCGEPHIPVPGQATVRDSAGIVIIEAPDLSGIDSVAWRVDRESGVTIGVTDGEDAYVFASIAGVARLGDGRLVVADRGTDEVRFYDTRGRFLHAVGGRGDGPGEYRSIAILTRLPEDSLMVVDRDGGRVTVLDHEGRQARQYLMVAGQTGELPTPAWGVFGDGTQLTMVFEGMEEIETGIIRHHSTFRRLREGTRTVADYEGAVQSLHMVNTALAGRDAGRDGPPPPKWAAGVDHFIFAPDPTRLEWWVYAVDGALERILRLEGPAPLAEVSATPGMEMFTADGSGRLWIKLAATAREGLEPAWIIWPPDGGARHALRLPPVSSNAASRAYPVMEIGSDYVLLASLNRDGAPVVRLLPLEKRSP